VIVVVVDIAVRVKLYGLTHVCNRSTVGKTECDETAGKVCYGEPSQFCCILVGLPDMLFRFRRPTAAFSTCMHIRYAYIRNGDGGAESKLEELAADIFHQPRARMDTLT
jgi:hypothetical protein